MGKDAGPAKKGGKTIEKTKVAAAKGESSTGVAERAGDAHGNEPVEPMAAMEAGALQELGGLAREMEDQLLREFETLLAKRKRRPLGTTTNGVGPEGGSQAAGPEGGKREDDPTYWKHMYEKLRDARETEAEKLLREMSSHAEQRERLVQDLMTQIKAMQSSGAAADPTTAAVEEEEEGEASGKQGEEAETLGPPPEQLEQWRAKEEELEAKIVRLKRLVLGYQRLTSICLSLEEEPPASAMDVDGQQQQQQAGLSTLSCTAINHLHKRAVRFSVQLDCDGSNSDDVLQADAHFRPLANKALLPAYLREEVSLETRQCPLLLLSVLKTLYSSKDPTAAQAAASSSSS